MIPSFFVFMDSETYNVVAALCVLMWRQVVSGGEWTSGLVVCLS